MNLYEAKIIVDKFVNVLANPDSENAIINERLIGHSRGEIYDAFSLFLTYQGFYQSIPVELFNKYRDCAAFVRFVVSDSDATHAKWSEKEYLDVLSKVIEDYKEHLKSHDYLNAVNEAIHYRENFSTLSDDIKNNFSATLCNLAYRYTYCDETESDWLFFIDFETIKGIMQRFMRTPDGELSSEDRDVKYFFKPYWEFIKSHGTNLEHL